MRFIPFGSGSIIPYPILSASYADYSYVAGQGISTITSSYAISGSKGPRGDDGSDQTEVGPYNTFPPS